MKLVSSFNELASKISSSVSSGTVTALGASFTLKQLTTALHTAAATLTNPLSGLSFSGEYGTTGGHLVVYVALDMSAPGSCTSSGDGCVFQTVPLNFGTIISGLGLNLIDPATGQAPTLNVAATMAVHFGLGFQPSTPSNTYVDPTGHVNLAVSVGTSALNATVNLGLLEATISSAAIGPVTGTIGLALPGGTTPLALASFDASDVAATVTANIDSLYTVTVGVASGVTINNGADVHSVGATPATRIRARSSGC